MAPARSGSVSPKRLLGSPQSRKRFLENRRASHADWREYYRWERDHFWSHNRVNGLYKRWSWMPYRAEYVKTIRELKNWQENVALWDDRIVKAETTSADSSRRLYVEIQKRHNLERLERRLKKFREIQQRPFPTRRRLEPKYAADMLKKTSAEIAAIDQARADGRVCCRGHTEEWRGADGVPADEQREEDRKALDEAWRYYYYSFTDLHQAPEDWVILGALDRALILFDHNDTKIYPPKIEDAEGDHEQDVEDLVETLKELHDAEQYAYKKLPIHWRSFESTVKDALANSAAPLGGNTLGKVTDAVVPVQMTNQDEETPDTLAPSRRALQHWWEERIRLAIQQERSPAHIAEQTGYYHLALRRFDAGRDWILDETEFDG
ncbi:Hypothetical predicted protein [Lecanosticta acicola]|uniref:Uncharacterized protein n=1 Tax=Lecanosticta acicola TaxID=111012 RepID=A0AAI8YWF9_9PEZI|nr:Hypothetical predicted protein [Lecanosticta acicola]